MNLTQNLLYLLLLYAVLDRGNKLSLTTGLIIAFAVMLFNCYYGRCCSGDRRNTVTGTNIFSEMNTL